MDECIEWSGARDRQGYGRRRYQGRNALAHRVAWTEAHGPIAEGLDVCHRCDNPACVNIDHLFLGTHQDNMRDCKTKGRGRNQFSPTNNHCRHGHDLAIVGVKNQRCVECRRIRDRNSKRRQRARLTVRDTTRPTEKDSTP